jgi:hypothetical protein
MNTTENNKIIAEFMQVEIQDKVYYILPQFSYCNRLTDFNTYDIYKANELKYHSSISLLNVNIYSD